MPSKLLKIITSLSLKCARVRTHFNKEKRAHLLSVSHRGSKLTMNLVAPGQEKSFKTKIIFKFIYLNAMHACILSQLHQQTCRLCEIDVFKLLMFSRYTLAVTCSYLLKKIILYINSNQIIKSAPNHFS